MRPTAVIDKSLLHAVCELPGAALDRCFNALLTHFVLVVPSVLVEEVWSDWAMFKRTSEPARTNLIRCLLHLRDAWIAEPLDIAFQELVEQTPIVEIPKPPSHVMNSFSILAPDDPDLHEWLRQTRERRKWIVTDRLRQQRDRLSADDAFLLPSPGKLLTDVVWPTLVGILSEPAEKAALLDGVLGQGFRYRNPEAGPQIDAAFARYTAKTFDHYPISTKCVLTALVYFYAPMSKIATSGGEPRKLLSRTKQGQQNNLADEKYIQSALLVAGLLTRDEGMRSVMDVFSEAGCWRGKTVFIDPKQNVATALEVALGSL